MKNRKSNAYFGKSLVRLPCRQEKKKKSKIRSTKKKKGKKSTNKLIPSLKQKNRIS